MAMPWSRAKAKARAYREHPETQAQLTELFDACFRIQREACAAAGRHIPLVVENVRGAQKWVGRSRWHFGSFHLWGDVPALMPMTGKIAKVPGFRFDGSGGSFQSASVAGIKVGGEWFGKGNDMSPMRQHSSKSSKRKAASAMIAKIPLELARWIGQSWLPRLEAA